jgi:hypothetical protein
MKLKRIKKTRLKKLNPRDYNNFIKNKLKKIMKLNSKTT